MGRLRITAETSSSKGLKVEEALIFWDGLSAFSASTSSFGRERGSAEGEGGKLRSLIGSVARGGAERADRRGAFEGVRSCDLALHLDGMVEDLVVVVALVSESFEALAPLEFGDVLVPIGFSCSGSCFFCAFRTLVRAQLCRSG